MITFSQYLNESQEPRWERDTERKVYIVYDKDGNAVKEFPYEQVWNSSGAYNAATDLVQDLKVYERQKQKDHHEYVNPLSDIEQQWVQGRAKMDSIHRELKNMPEGSPEYQLLHDDYMKTVTFLQSIKNFVRSSVVMGTHKDLQK